jgi:hypothetical protein
VHITCSQEEQPHDQQQQQANGAANSSSSISSSGPCAQLLAQWRQSGLLEPQVKWKTAAAADDDDEDSENEVAADGAAAAVKAERRQRRLQRQQQQQQQQLGGAAGQAPAGLPESWIVLGIESSCDDTAAAVVRGDGTVLSHCIASQVGAVRHCVFFCKIGLELVVSCS